MSRRDKSRALAFVLDSATWEATGSSVRRRLIDGHWLFMVRNYTVLWANKCAMLGALVRTYLGERTRIVADEYAHRRKMCNLPFKPSILGRIRRCFNECLVRYHGLLISCTVYLVRVNTWRAQVPSWPGALASIIMRIKKQARQRTKLCGKALPAH